MLETRRQKENSLSESDAKYKAIFENTGTAMMIVDEDTTISMVNTESQRIFGYSKKELEGKRSWTEFVVKKHLARMNKYHRLRRNSLNVAPRSYESQLIDKHGNIRDVLLTVAMIPGTRKSAISIIDVTERNRMDEKIRKYSEHLEQTVEGRTRELQESEERFRGIAENSFDEIYETDLEGRFTYASPAVERMTGYKPDDIIGKTLQSFLPEKEIAKAAQGFDAIAAGKGVEGMQLEIVKKDGSLRYVEINASPKIIDGKVIGLQGIARDVTKRKKVEEERDRFFNLSIDMKCICGFDGYFKQMNPAWEKTLGWTRQELMSRPYLSLVHPDDREATIKAVEGLSRGETVVGFDNRYLCKDGSYRWVSWNAFPFKKEQLIFAVARDITGRKQMDEQLRRHVEEIKMLNRSITQRLVQKISQIDNVSKIRERLRKVADVSTGLNLVLDAGLDNLGLDVGAVLIIDPEGNTARLRAFKSKIEGVKVDESYPLNANFVEFVALKDDKIVSKTEQSPPSILGISNIHCAPIHLGKQAYGILTFGGQESRTLDESDLSIMGLYAEVISTLFERQSLTIVPMKEMATSGKKRFDLEFGCSYLVRNSVEEAYDIFVDNVLSGLKGLCITREFPPKVREMYGLEKTPIVWLTEEKVENQVCVHSLQELSILIGGFLEKVRRGVVLLDGIEYLITNHGFESFIRFLQLNRSRFEQSDSILVAPLIEEALAVKEARLIEREMKPLKFGLPTEKDGVRRADLPQFQPST